MSFRIKSKFDRDVTLIMWITVAIVTELRVFECTSHGRRSCATAAVAGIDTSLYTRLFKWHSRCRADTNTPRVTLSTYVTKGPA